MGLEDYPTQYKDPITGNSYNITYNYTKDRGANTDITEGPTNRSPHNTFTATVDIPERDKYGQLTGKVNTKVMENQEALRFRSQVEFDGMVVDQCGKLGVAKQLIPVTLAAYKSLFSEDGVTFKGYYKDPNEAVNKVMSVVNGTATSTWGANIGPRLTADQVYELLGVDKTGTSYRNAGKVYYDYGNSSPNEYGSNSSIKKGDATPPTDESND
jgi:hypothetical protein